MQRFKPEGAGKNGKNRLMGKGLERFREGWDRIFNECKKSCKNCKCKHEKN